MEVKYLLVISDRLRGGRWTQKLTQVLSMTVRGSYLALQLLVAVRFACLLSRSRVRFWPSPRARCSARLPNVAARPAGLRSSCETLPQPRYFPLLM